MKGLNLVWNSAHRQPGDRAYLTWINRHERGQWNRERQDQKPVLSLHHDLDRHQTALLSRCSELDCKLNERQRILR